MNKVKKKKLFAKPRTVLHNETAVIIILNCENMCHKKIWRISLFPRFKRYRKKLNYTFKLVVLKQKSSYINQY